VEKESFFLKGGQAVQRWNRKTRERGKKGGLLSEPLGVGQERIKNWGKNASKGARAMPVGR